MRRRTCFRVMLACVAGLAAPTAPAAAAPRAVYVGSYEWSGSSPLFGGFSALDLAADGVSFVTVSDSVAVVTGILTRGHDGAVTAVSASAPMVPNTHHGTPVLPPMDDAEGVVLAPDGSLFISYETQNRIVQYADNGQIWMDAFWPKAFESFEINAGAEALAMADDGTLYTMPEKPLVQGGDYPVFRYRNGIWSQPFDLARSGQWRPVGADFGPDGRLYILERNFWGLLGFMSRVRRLTLAADRIAADEVLLETSAGQHDNLEGIAVWRDASGATRLTMISDDNFLPNQRTELVDYRIEE